MALTVSPFPKHAFYDNNGNPAASFQLFTYTAGTSTKFATYSDSAGLSANSNPIVLDSAGRCTLFLQAASYKFVLANATDTDPPTSPIWTIDNVSATPSFNVNVDLTGTAGETLTANNCVYISAGSGGLTAGRWYRADADNTYSSTIATQIGFVVANASSGAAVSVRVAGQVTGLAGLSAGSVYYVSATAGDITNSAPANRRAVGTADSTTTLVIAPVQGANEIAGPLPASIGALPAVSGTALTGIAKHLAAYSATVGNVGAGEDILASSTITAATLTTTGDRVSGVYWGQSANNANVKTLRVRIIEGANNTVMIAATLTVSQTGHWLLGFAAIRTGAATFRGSAQMIVGPTNGVVTKSSTNVTSSSTVTWANAVEVRLSGEATTDNDITMEGGYLMLSLV